jgi:hypothetical protein
MYLSRKLEDPDLIDLLAIHTNRLTQMMIFGENYKGEYDTCRRIIETLQHEIQLRRELYINTVSSNTNFNRSSAA